MTFISELDVALRARFTLIVVATIEEARVIEAIRESCSTRRREMYEWDLIRGFVTREGDQPIEAADHRGALSAIEGASDSTAAVFVLKDFHEFWKDTGTKRALRNAAQSLKTTRKSIVVITPDPAVPDELKDDAVILDFPLPDAQEIEEVLDLLSKTPNLDSQLTGTGREQLIRAALGLTHSQAHRAFSKAIVSDGRLSDEDIDLVTQEKKQIIRESRAVEYYTASETPDEVGGLGVLKEWLRLRERAFSPGAREYGLPAPKGVALIGIPGTGKSLTAKMVASAWHLPLLRLDVGSVFGSLVGESEERIRTALAVAEAVAPCVMWIDEIEKSLAQGGLDGGTSQRVFGTILTWMQDKSAPVFVVATANDVAAMPPELLRRGRFDEIFFLDLPTADEREEIFRVHLHKRGRVPEEYDLDLLSRESAGYVGAEIEQAVIDAMFVAFNDGPREFKTDDIAESLHRLVPLSRSQRERIEMLRNWLREGRAQSASFSMPEEASSHQVPLEILTKD